MFSHSEGHASGRVYSASEGQGAVRGHGLASGLGQRKQGQGQSKSNAGQGQSNINQGQGQHYQGSKAWWSVGEFLHQGPTHQSVGLSLGHPEEETWDISDSLADLYQAVTQHKHEEVTRQRRLARRGSGDSSGQLLGDSSVDKKLWLNEDTSHGFIRVNTSENENSSRLFPCTLSTTAQKICLQLGIPGNSLHVQMNGDVIRRMEPSDCPLAVQNEYLGGLGYEDVKYIQQEGLKQDLAFLIRFYAGKPMSDSTYSRNQLQTYAFIRKGKLLHQWVRRWCVISGTRLLIYRDKGAQPTVMQLSKGSVEEVQIKGQSLVLKLTSTYQGERSIYLSFTSLEDYNKWIRKIRKATVKLPSKADLSSCHLEFIPENVFMNPELQILILRHNALRERPIDEDIYTIGWLDDLPNFTSLRSLNLADNQLMMFPLSLTGLQFLMELNLASNKLEELPPEISKLVSLQVLHLHNNQLASLPEEMAQMRNLTVVVLAFNRFVNIPAVLLQSQRASFKLDSIIMAGNEISRLPADHLSHMSHIRKIDLRLNKLQLLPTQTAKFQSLEHITHVDIRENNITDLDIRAIRCLEYLNCEHNSIKSLQINGNALKNVFASHNCTHTLTISPKPEWLVTLNVAHNQLTGLPSWLPDCLFLVQLDVRHNQLTALPDRLFTDAKRLKIVKASHNLLTSLPEKIRTDMLEELHLQNNVIKQLSVELFIKAHRLRYLNMTRNKLCDLPPPNKNDSYNKLQELYLSFNHLNNRCLHKICCFPRLRVLHLASNKLSAIEETDIEKLEQLMELNVSSNNLTYLPAVLGRHPKLQVLRANCNLLQELPNFKNSSGIKVLEVSSNHLVNVNMSNLMASQMSLLDISANPNILVKSHDIDIGRNPKKLCMIDMRGQNLSLEDVRVQADLDDGQLWQTGLSQTSGIRNKLSVTAINKPHLNDQGEALFAVFDGGRNDAVASILCDIMPVVLREERTRNKNPYVYLKMCFLSAHRNLKAQGQKLGSAAAVVHISKENQGQYMLSVANVGDVQVVLCRQKQAFPLSRNFVTTVDADDNKRVVQSGGIITEDGRVSGVTYNTRLLGCSYLFPYVIPDPHITSTTLTSDDTFFIVASHGLWHYVSYDEAIYEVMDIPDPVVAAKRLQDLAQGYGSRENISVLVVRLMLTEEEMLRIKDLMVVQRSAQKELLKVLSCQEDLLQLRDGVPKVAELRGVTISKSGHAKKHYVSRKHLINTKSVSSFLPEEVLPTPKASPEVAHNMERIVSFHDEVSQTGMNSHKKMNKKTSEDNSAMHKENYFSRKEARLSDHSSSDTSVKRLASYAPNNGLSQRCDDRVGFDNHRNNDSRGDRDKLGSNPGVVLPKKTSTDFIVHHVINEQTPMLERASDDDDDIFISAEESTADVIHVTRFSVNSQTSFPGNSRDSSDRQSDFYYRMSPIEDFNVSPSESVSSIDVRVQHEADEIYKLRFQGNHQIQDTGQETMTPFKGTKIYSSALSETGQLDQNEFYTRPVSPDSIVSQDEFVKPPVNFANIDRDALFFHQMQLARVQTQAGSNTSLDSIQSAPMQSSSKDGYSIGRASSHSIEVLLNLGDNKSSRNLSDSLKGGRVVVGSSLVGKPPGTSPATSSCVANVDSGSESRSYSLKNFQRTVEADVHVSTTIGGQTGSSFVGGENSNDEDVNDSDNDTLIGDAQDLTQLEDFGFIDQNCDQTKERIYHEDWSLPGLDRLLEQNRIIDAASDSDSDDSLGNLSLEDGYSAIQFVRTARGSSLSMMNVLESETEDFLEPHLAQRYIKNKAKSGKKAGNFVNVKLGNLQKEPVTAGRYQDEGNHYECIDVFVDNGTDSISINDFEDDINPYENEHEPPQAVSTNTTAATTSILRQASISSEEDIDAFYAQVHKLKRDKLKTKSTNSQAIEEQVQPYLPMFHPEGAQSKTQTVVGKSNSREPLYVVQRNEGNEIFIGTSENRSVPPSENRSVPSSENRSVPPSENRSVPPSENRSVPPSENRSVPPHSKAKPSFAPTSSTSPSSSNKNFVQGKQLSQGDIRNTPTQSTFGSHEQPPPSPGLPPRKLSQLPNNMCNNPDTDRPVPLSGPSSNSSDQTILMSFKPSVPNIGGAAASHFHPAPTQQHQTQNTSMPSRKFQELKPGASSAKPSVPAKPLPGQMSGPAVYPSSFKPAPAMESFKQAPPLVQSENRSQSLSQSPAMKSFQRAPPLIQSEIRSHNLSQPPVMESFKQAPLPVQSEIRSHSSNQSPAMKSFQKAPPPVQSEIRSYNLNQSILSAHELYPDTYQPRLSFYNSTDIQEAASKLSSQKSINITYL